MTTDDLLWRNFLSPRPFQGIGRVGRSYEWRCFPAQPETANEKFRVTDLICGERARRHVHNRAELCTRLRAATLQVMLVWRRAPGRGQTRPLMMSPTLHVMGLASLRRTRPALTGTVTYTAVVRSSRVVLNDERVQLHTKHIVSNSKVRKVQHTTVNDQTVNMKT